jgi:cyclopropane fatty-acyl-phospholipid synthase-like methyltransferase
MMQKAKKENNFSPGLSDMLKGYLPVDRFRLRKRNFYSTMAKNLKESINLIEQGVGWKEQKKCPLCGSERKKYELSKGGIEMVACLRCSLRYATKVPHDSSYIYQSPLYKQRTGSSYLRSYEYRKKRFGSERIKLIESYLGALKGKKILDVGSGCGYFLACAKEKGADCLGIELSGPVREWARKKTGLRIVATPLNELSAQEKFDAITLFDIIEHVACPLGLLRQAERHLNKRGIIVLFTPNFDSFAVMAMREESNLIFPTDHLVSFTRRSLEFACRLGGLRIIHLETCGMDIADMLAFLEEKGNFKEAAFLSKWEHQLQAVINRAGVGNHLRIVARKA